MTDLREFKMTIKNAVARERKLDENWSWRIDGITKTEIRIGWGYLDYMECDGCFKIEAHDKDDEVMISFHDHLGELKGLILVGDYFWDDAKTVNKGLEITINALANMAHELY